MNWFVYALICVFGWGCADLFYKKGTDETDKYSQYKIAVWVGLGMGIVSLFLLPFAETTFSLGSFFGNATKYLPASLGYIISMVIGYAGLRYLEVSVISPVQNSSGALSAIAMTAIFLILGKEIDYTAIDYIGTGVIVSGVVALAIVEQRLSLNERSLEVKEEDKKYRFGALALIFPVLYCVFDTIGTAADGIILDDEVGLGLGDIDVLVIYGLTFMFAGLVCWIIMFAKTKKPYNPFKRSETPKGAAALAEEFGQIFYVFAMGSNPVLAAPMIASYCVVSVVLSRIFLKEKLKLSQYLCVIAVIAGIIMLGVSEGLSEL